MFLMRLVTSTVMMRAHFPQTQVASNEAPPSQAANSDTQDGAIGPAIRPYYTRSGREVRPPKRFQDYTK